jgi:hypothetical protein
MTNSWPVKGAFQIVEIIPACEISFEAARDSKLWSPPKEPSSARILSASSSAVPGVLNDGLPEVLIDVQAGVVRGV